MLGDVWVFPVPELLPGRSWGGDKGQGCSHLLLRCGRFCPLDIRTEGGRTRPCFVSVFPGVLLLSPHSSPCTLGSGACMYVCVCVSGGWASVVWFCCRNPEPDGLLVPAYRAPNSPAWLCHWPCCPTRGSELP